MTTHRSAILPFVGPFVGPFLGRSALAPKERASSYSVLASSSLSGSNNWIGNGGHDRGNGVLVDQLGVAVPA